MTGFLNKVGRRVASALRLPGSLQTSEIQRIVDAFDSSQPRPPYVHLYEKPYGESIDVGKVEPVLDTLSNLMKLPDLMNDYTIFINGFQKLATFKNVWSEFPNSQLRVVRIAQVETNPGKPIYSFGLDFGFVDSPGGPVKLDHVTLRGYGIQLIHPSTDDRASAPPLPPARAVTRSRPSAFVS